MTSRNRLRGGDCKPVYAAVPGNRPVVNRILNKYALFVLSGLFFGFLIISSYSCISEIVEYSPTRTILFYIATDNNRLDNGNFGDEPRTIINEIRAGWIPYRGEMLIYTDQTNRPPCLMRINETRDANGLYGLDTIRIYSEENSADAGVLNRIILEVVNDYPADSYGMLFFSHASGWLPEGMLVAPRNSDGEQQYKERINRNEAGLRSLVIDIGEGDAREMEYDDFAAAIPDKQFDFIIFDACFIADVMMMFELRNKAEYVLASSAEIVSPGFTPVYRNNIMRLYDMKSPTASVVAGFAQSYISLIISSYREDDVLCSATLGVIKMSEMQNLASTVKDAINDVEFNELTLRIDSIQRFDRPNKLISSGYIRRNRYFDLEHVMENLLSDQLVDDSHYKAFQDQLAKTVVWKANTKRFLLRSINGMPYFSEYDGFFIEHHSGFSTYIEQEVYPALNAAYKSSSWYKAIY